MNLSYISFDIIRAATTKFLLPSSAWTEYSFCTTQSIQVSVSSFTIDQEPILFSTSRLRFQEVCRWDGQAFHIICANKPLSPSRCLEPAEFQMEWLGFGHALRYVRRAAHVHASRQQRHLVPTVKCDHIVWHCTRPMHVGGDFTATGCCSNLLAWWWGKSEQTRESLIEHENTFNFSKA